MQHSSTKVERTKCLGCLVVNQQMRHRSAIKIVTCWQSQQTINNRLNHMCHIAGSFLVPASDTACSLEPAIAIAVFSLRCFLLPVWLRVTACSDSPVARRRGLLIRGSSLYSGRAIPCLRGRYTTDTCLRRFRVWGGRRMWLSAWCAFRGSCKC